MVESVGKKLHQARLQRGLTIDEAAHATKLRPDKIAALEADDYSRFANNIYAKGFLHIYGRFLNVDVTDFARTLDNANPISISDYQYLSNAPEIPRETTAVRREERRPPSLAPLFFFLILVGLGFAGMWIHKNYERIQAQPIATTSGTPEGTEAPVPNPDAAFVSNPPSPAANPTPAVVAAIPARADLATPTPNPASSAPATPPPGAPGPSPLAASDQDFVTSTPVDGAAAAAPMLPPGGVNEVLVATVKKTWVTVRRDDPKAPPIFEDYVYPNASPLKLRGARFFIEARDPGSVQITKNGLPYAYRASGEPVQ